MWGCPKLAKIKCTLGIYLLNVTWKLSPIVTDKMFTFYDLRLLHIVTKGGERAHLFGEKSQRILKNGCKLVA